MYAKCQNPSSDTAAAAAAAVVVVKEAIGSIMVPNDK
jgi:hypothetical protein